MNPLIEADQCDRLTQLRDGRDHTEVSRLLALITETDQGDKNLLYPMKETPRARATVGEVSDALRAV